MENRIVEFISALRSNGARVSLAESADAVRAVTEVGILDKNTFRVGLKSTLVKEPADAAIFENLFPHYFGSDGPEMQPVEGLTEEQMQQLQDAIENLRDQISELMRQLANGEKPSREQLEQAATQAGISPNMRGSEQLREWMTQRMQRQMGLTQQQVKDALEALLKQLKEQGMDAEGRQEVRDTVRENAESMRQQVARFVGSQMQRQPDENRDRQRIDDLMNRPLASLSGDETDELRAHVRRLVAQLRSRASLRMRRANREKLDVRRTLRHSQRYGGVPIELKQKKHALKPKITIIIDVSTSMRPVAEFMLRLVYEMQDQIGKARSFAFIGDMHEISMVFSEHRPESAIPIVLEMLPPGHYSTDLGNSLATFCNSMADAVDHRTILIFVGDARNNYNDPRADLAADLKRRARRVLWFNPENPYEWNTGDSDMNAYLTHATAVHQVATLKQLSDAIDSLFERHYG